MAPLGSNRDQWIADIASFVRNSFGNVATWVTAADVARVRAATSGRTSPWTLAELELSLPRLLIPDATWSATASHNSARAAGALDYTRWTSDAPQQPGMWIQIALPAPVMLTEIQFDSPPIGGGRGAQPTPRFHGRTVSRSPPTGRHGARRLPKVKAVAGRRRSRSRRCERASCVSLKPQRSRTVRCGRSSACGSTSLLPVDDAWFPRCLPRIQAEIHGFAPAWSWSGISMESGFVLFAPADQRLQSSRSIRSCGRYVFFIQNITTRLAILVAAVEITESL